MYHSAQAVEAAVRSNLIIAHIPEPLCPKKWLLPRMPLKPSYFPLSWPRPSWVTRLTRKIVFDGLVHVYLQHSADVIPDPKPDSWHKPIHHLNVPHLKRSSGICQSAANMPTVVTAVISPQPPKINTPQYSIQHVHLIFFLLDYWLRSNLGVRVSHRQQRRPMVSCKGTSCSKRPSSRWAVAMHPGRLCCL